MAETRCPSRERHRREAAGLLGELASSRHRVEAVKLRRYRLPLRQPWSSARGRVGVREGWLVSVASHGVWGYGDCAPLPEAGTETPELAGKTLRDSRSRLPGQALLDILEQLSTLADSSPAAAWALDCAVLDLVSRLRGLPLRALLVAHPETRIPVNEALGALPDLAEEDLLRAAAAGFRVLKIKVGLADIHWELARLSWLAMRLPIGLSLRLDANGAWDPPRAAAFLDGLAGLPIECLEEPLASPDPHALGDLQSRVRFSLALDESLPRFLTDGRPASLPVRRAVLKPAALGGLRRTLALGRELRRMGLEVAVTSILDPAAGLWPTAQLAAAIGRPVHHGLATAHWLLRDLGEGPMPECGLLHLPERPGSGFCPAEAPLRAP